MSAPSASEFYGERDQPPQQGDILLGAVARVVGDDGFSPSRWVVLDEARCELLPAQVHDGVTMPSLRVAAGRALCMVTTHDCGLDKEFNHVVEEQLADGEVDEVAVVDEAEGRVDLDRNLQVSPLVDPQSVTVAGTPVDQGLLMSGRIIGYLPVPQLIVGGREITPRSVVDLNYRTTLDRLAYTRRLASVSEAARERLRYTLARLDVLRTPTLEAQLSDVIGKRVVSARVHKKNALIVQLRLEDGATLELLHKPGSPDAGPVARSQRSVRGGPSSP